MKATESQQEALNVSIKRGLSSFHRPMSLTLSQWAAQHFYLSAESSYVQGRWEAYPYQVAIMDAVSNDDIDSIWFMKSARVGATKILLAAVGYFAEHKKRNQALWQPTDSDSLEFSKTEVDTFIRDCPAVRDIFPSFEKKSKYNTTDQKQFTGSMLHLRGGKSAKNYRRLSVDCAYLDEYAAFDSDVDKEGDPGALAGKRLEGSTFPKLVGASTPKIHGTCLMEGRFDAADMRMRFHIPCVHCGREQHLEFGGKDVAFGLKWNEDEGPKSAAYLCKFCGALFDQGDYLDTWQRGVWRDSDNGCYIDPRGFFRDVDDQLVDPPDSLGFHIWTAYSPQTTWSKIVKEFLTAKSDPDKLKAFTNTTLGQTWVDVETEKMEKEVLFNRREHYKAELPAQCCYITAGIDVQDDRFEMIIEGWGALEERYSLAYVRLFGDPSRPELWGKVADVLRRQFSKEDGTVMGIGTACMDHGGHYSDEVNKFSKRMGLRFLIPIKGSSIYGSPVAVMPRKRNRHGVYLTTVGTDTGKDLMFQRMAIMKPGPGYWHFPVHDDFDIAFFTQLTAEERISKFVQGRRRYVWEANKRRNEAWDCANYSLAAIRIAQSFMGLHLHDAQLIVELTEDDEKPTAKPMPETAPRQQKNSYIGGDTGGWMNG